MMCVCIQPRLQPFHALPVRSNACSQSLAVAGAYTPICVALATIIRRNLDPSLVARLDE